MPPAGSVRRAADILARVLLAALLALNTVALVRAVPRVLSLGEPEELGLRVAFSAWHAAALLATVLALAILARAWQREDARALALFLVFAALAYGGFFGDRYHPLGRLVEGSPRLEGAYEAVVFCGLGLAYLAFVRFSVLFPRPLSADALREYQSAPAPRDSLRYVDAIEGRVDALALRALARVRRSATPAAAAEKARRRTEDLVMLLEYARSWRPWVHAAGVVALFALFVAVGEGRGPRDPLGTWLIVMGGFLFFPAMIAALLLSLVGVHFMRVSYALAGEAERKRMLWVVEGFLGMVWIALVLWAMGLASHLVGRDALGELFIASSIGAAPLALLLALALAMFYHGALDPSLALRKTALYGLLGTTLTVLFAVVETVVSDLLAERLGLPPSTGSLVGGVAVAITLAPLRDVLQRRLAPRSSAVADAANAAVATDTIPGAAT